MWNRNSDEAVFCPECGSMINKSTQRICIECGTAISDEAVFCPECGKKNSEIPLIGQQNPIELIKSDSQLCRISASTPPSEKPGMMRKQNLIAIAVIALLCVGAVAVLFSRNIDGKNSDQKLSAPVPVPVLSQPITDSGLSVIKDSNSPLTSQPDTTNRIAVEQNDLSENSQTYASATIQPFTDSDTPVIDDTEQPPHPTIHSTATPQEILTNIPYYGNPAECRLTAEQAIAYGGAIETAKFYFKEDDSFGMYLGDGFYPVLIDVSGDGIPLLLIVVGNPPDDYGYFGVGSHCLIYGYKDGCIQTLHDPDNPMIFGDICVCTVNGEKVLGRIFTDQCEGAWDRSEYYRIKNGEILSIFSAEISYWIADWGEYGDFNSQNTANCYINEEKVNRTEYEEKLKELKIVNEEEIITSWGDGYTVTSSFAKYMTKNFDRSQAINVFQGYADALSTGGFHG